MKKSRPSHKRYDNNSNHRPDRVAKREYVNNYKLERGCSVCGYNKCSAALELDHIDRTQKKFKLSDAQRKSWKSIYEEIAKCVVLCANCHREKTQIEKDFMALDFEEPADLQLDLL